MSYFLRNKIIKAVDNVVLELHKGESIGIAGESWCGKSILVSVIMSNISDPGNISAVSINFYG